VGAPADDHGVGGVSVLCGECGFLDVDPPERFCLDCHQRMDDAYYAVLAPAERVVERAPRGVPRAGAPAAAFPIVDSRR
jgi:hypothetical protein